MTQDIGTIIHELRGDRSLNSIAKETGLGITQIRRIENGELKYPTFETISKIADSLGYKIVFTKKTDVSFGETI